MKIEKINNGWQFTENGVTTTIDIPHDYMIGHKRRAGTVTGVDEGFFEVGKAAYQRNFNVQSGKSHHFIRFDGVMGLCEVYINGHRAAFHPYGYTPFICIADDYLKDGENEIRVMVDGTQKPSSRWYAGAGIYRDAELLTSDADYIVPDGIAVRTISASGDSAYIEAEFSIHSETSQTAVLSFDVDDGGAPLKDSVRHIWLNKGENTCTYKIPLHGITLWSPDSPKLYKLNARLKTDSSEDCADVRFGIRTIEVDSERGFILNGSPVVMNGVCIHHDNGIIGASSVRAAEKRRLGILKRDGYNAVRCSHNPPSRIMLDVCDELGLLVIDEAFDAWRIGKREYDYHIWFDVYAEEDLKAMILRDRNHPSVVMWSTGNEIPEKTGVSDGYKTAKFIADVIRKYDRTRPLTHALCSFWDNGEYNAKMYETEHYPAEKLDFFAEKTMYLADALDVSGYNYFIYRLDKDSVRFPDRVFAITESFPMDAFKAKKYMDEHPHMIGEFVWTGWDYFGETGIGHLTYEGEQDNFLVDYPCHISNCGDYDICGFYKPQWYYRHAAYHKGEVWIMTANPKKYGKKYTISAWGFYDVDRTWTYPGCEGMKTEISLYTSADEAELFVNGQSLGRHCPDENGIIRLEAEYNPGVLTAVAYIGGKRAGEDKLETTGKAESIRLTQEETTSELVYVTAELLDSCGRVAWDSESEVVIEAEGAAVIGTGSGDVYSEHDYFTNICTVHNGRLIAAFKPNGQKITVKAVCGGLTSELIIDQNS